MSQIDTMRQAIVTALKNITGLATVNVTDIRPAETIADVWETKRYPVVLVVYRGLVAQPATQAIGSKKLTPCLQDWDIVVASMGLRGPVQARTKTLGADELVEAVRDIRGVAIGPTGHASVTLFLHAEELLDPEGRPPDGGPVAYVCRYRTSQSWV
jgi:hypothetical protein